MNGNSAVPTMKRVTWIAIQAPYDAQLVERFKQLFPVRAFDKTTKEWLVPAERAAEARTLLVEHFGRVEEPAPPRTAQPGPAAGVRPSR